MRRGLGLSDGLGSERSFKDAVNLMAADPPIIVAVLESGSFAFWH